MPRVILLFLLTVISSLNAAGAANMLYKIDLKNQPERKLWKLVHIRGDNSLLQRNDSEGIALYSKGSGKALDSFYRSITIKDQKKIGVKLTIASHIEKLPLLVCLSGSPGCGLPAIKQKPRLAPGSAFQTIDLVYEAYAFPDGNYIIELIVEGIVPQGKLVTVKNLEIFEVPPPPLEIFQSPASGIVYSKTGEDSTVSARWKFNTKPVELTFKLTGNDKPLEELKPEKDASGEAEFDLSKYDNGNYNIGVFVKGKLWNNCLFKKIPSQENSLIIKNRTPYLNGKPYFAIGLFHTGDTALKRINRENRKIGVPEITRTEMLTQVKERNFNAVHYSWSTASKDFCEEAARFGLNVISESKHGMKDIPRVKNIMNEPNCLGYYIFDEPNATEYDRCSDIYKAFKETDPYHPTMIAFDMLPSGGSEEPLMDIAMLDPYPIKNAKSNVSSIITYMANARKYLHNYAEDTCEYSVNQLFYISGSRFSVEPTIEQAKAEVYAALVGGAKGICYYAYWTHEKVDKGMTKNPKRKQWFLPDSILWDQIGEVNAEIAKYSDFFLLGTPAPEFTVKGANNARSWRLGDRVLLLAVNTSGSKSDRGTIKFPAGWKSDTPCSNGGGIRMKPYDTRKWLFQLDR